MTNIDQRSAITMGTAGAALLANSATTSAQGAGEAARNKEILTPAYKLWHDTKGGSVKDWMEIVEYPSGEAFNYPHISLLQSRGRVRCQSTARGRAR